MSSVIENLCHVSVRTVSMKRKKQFSRTNIKSFNVERLIEFMFRFDGVVSKHVKSSDSSSDSNDSPKKLIDEAI